ncbi:uncharacterized protein LOC108217445 [Daucus carota subsp. sativus]|uniref:Uncharacterized protein n=1 Tax=Daucus carota subsp. sativus TaxID=79200 RepID=A0A162ACB8_DAUCS|nr:PREDICTED: uncharacterized protein LOC108217445 [Daucus carota subsp. sativus]
MGVQRDGNVVKKDENFGNVVKKDENFGNVVNKDENFGNVGTFPEIRRGVVEKLDGEASSTANLFSDAGRDDNLCRENAVLADEKSREIKTEKQGSDVERKLPDKVFEKNNELTDLKEGKSESLGIQESREESPDQPQNKSSEKLDGNSPTGLNLKQEDEEEDDDEDKNISDSGSERTLSDRTVSISPGNSMAEISPTDELHPLLDEDAPLPTHMSPEVSDATSEISSNTISESSYDIDTDMETHGGGELEITDLEEDYADNDDDDVKSAVSWTDDDHKNVINLGSSDLERNQRLENLIATRSLRKSMKMMAERDLIDLDGMVRPLNVAHISTARHNPFNLPADLNSNMPESAPSIMARRRSPFELSYDPGEEKHHLLGDDCEHVVTLQPKDPPLLRRNETFSAGISLHGTPRHDYNLRQGYIHHRKLSTLSESKESSEPETESLGSVEELEDKVPVEEDDSQEPVVTTIAEHPSEDVGHGSESSEDEDTVNSTEADKKDATADDIKVNFGDVENSQEKVSRLSVADTHMEGDTSEANEVVTPDDNSSTSLPEEHGNEFNEKEGEQLSHFKPTMESSDAESSSQSVNGTPHKGPVYDSSPNAHNSSSSLFSDHQVDIVETNSPPVSVEHKISATDNESDLSNQITEKDTPASETDEKLISAHHQSPSENNTSIQSDKELPLPDQSVVERSPVKHEILQDSGNASEVQEPVEEAQHGKPTTSDAASRQSEISEREATSDRPRSEDNIPSVGNSDTILISEKTDSGPAESEEVPSRDAGEKIPDMSVQSGTVKDREPRHGEDKHADDGSGESEISPQTTLDKSPNETKDDSSEHELRQKSSEPDKTGSESSRSIKDDHSEQQDEEASNKREPPESNIDGPKEPPQPKPWWNRF